MLCSRPVPVSAAEAGTAPASFVGQEFDAGHPYIVAWIVGDESCIVEKRGRGNPGVRNFNPPDQGACHHHYLCPFVDRVAGRWHGNETLHVGSEANDSFGSPLRVCQE